MKIVLKYPDKTFYNRSMIDGIANGLSALGHKTLCLNDDIEDKKLSDVISFCDAFIQINNVRDETQQNFKCIFISWIQDVYSSDTKMTFEKNRWQPKRNDQFYFLCDPEILGFDLSAINPDQNCGVLLTGIEPQHFSQDAHENRPKQWGRAFAKEVSYIVGTPAVLSDSKLNRIGLFDQSFIFTIDLLRKLFPNSAALGNLSIYMAQKINGDTILKRDFLQLSKIVEEEYVPFSGALEIDRIAKILMHSPIFKRLSIGGEFTLPKNNVIEDYAILIDNLHHISNKPFQTLNNIRKILKKARGIETEAILNFHLIEKIDYLSQTYPRLMDRNFIVKSVSEVTTDLSIWSNNDDLDAFKPYYCGNLTSHDELRLAYQSSHMTLHSNNHGLACHTRVLEALAYGSKIVLHTSGHRDTKVGGLSSLADYSSGIIECTPENLKDKIVEELEQRKSNIFMKCHKKNMALIKQKITADHNWVNRAGNN